MSAKDKDKTSFNYDISHHEDTAHSQGAKKLAKAGAKKKDASKEKTFVKVAKSYWGSIGTTPASIYEMSAKDEDGSSSNYDTNIYESTVDLQGVTDPMRYNYLAGSSQRAYNCDWPNCGAHLGQIISFEGHMQKDRSERQYRWCRHILASEKDAKNH